MPSVIIKQRYKSVFFWHKSSKFDLAVTHPVLYSHQIIELLVKNQMFSGSTSRLMCGFMPSVLFFHCSGARCSSSVVYTAQVMFLSNSQYPQHHSLVWIYIKVGNLCLVSNGLFIFSHKQVCSILTSDDPFIVSSVTCMQFTVSHNLTDDLYIVYSATSV